MTGAIILRTECECGRQATLTSEQLGEDAMMFMDFHKLRCSTCGRKGRPTSVTRLWAQDPSAPNISGDGSD